MPGEDWSREEVEATVGDYFAMLHDELAGLPINKAEHNERLRRLLRNRSKGSVEFKHANISALLTLHGYPYIDGYKPRFNFQALLEQAVLEYLDVHRDFFEPLIAGPVLNPTGSPRAEMRDRIIGALDTGCRRGETLKIQKKQVDWRHRWIRILKEHSKTEVARVIPFEAGSRLEKLLRRRAFLGPDAYVFGEATTGAYVASFKSAWETLLLLANGIKPTRAGSGKRVSNRKALAQIDLHWHDLRHEALSRLADDGVPVHELQLLAGHASITTTQRYMNARASSLAESMRQARERRVKRVEHGDEATAQIG